MGETETDPADEQTEGSGDKIVTPVPDDNTDPADGSGAGNDSGTEDNTGAGDESDTGINPPPEINDGSETGDDAENGDDINADEPAEDGEPAEPEEPVADPSVTPNAVDGERAAAPAAPVFTVKQGGKTLAPGAAVRNRAANVTFTLSTATKNAEIYYSTDAETAPRDGDSYSDVVTLEAPDTDEAATMTIKAVAVIPESSDDEGNTIPEKVSAAASFSVKFAAKKKVVSLDGSESEDLDQITVMISGKKVTQNEENDTFEIPNANNPLSMKLAVPAGKKYHVLIKNANAADEAKYSVWNSIYPDKSGNYTIPKDALADDVLVKVTRMRTIKVDWQGGANWGMVGITVSSFFEKGKGKNTAIWDGPNSVAYVAKDTYVDIQVDVLEGKQSIFGLASISVTEDVENAEAGTPVEPAEGTDSVITTSLADPIDKDYVLTVTGAGKAYGKANVADKEGESVTSRNKTYQVDPRADYVISAVMNDFTAPYSIGKVIVKDNNKQAAADVVTVTEVAESTAGEDDNEDTPAQGTGKWNLALSANAGGKTLQVELYDTAGTKKVDTLTLKVAPVIKKVTVSKVTNDALKQVIGTTQTYNLTPAKGQTGSNDKLSVKDLTEDQKKYITSVEVSDDSKKLTITTKAAAPVSATEDEIAILNQTALDAGEAEDSAKVASFKLTTTAPAWAVVANKKNAGAAPTVTLAKATDTELYVNIKAPNGVTADVLKTAGTAFCYKVTTKAQTKKDNYTYIDDDTARYYAAGESVTLSQRIPVIEKEFGQGTDSKFNVTVEMIWYAAEDVTPGENNTVTAPAEEKIIASSKAVVKNGKNAFSTKAPYYAEKLSFTKKTKAANNLFTGQTAEIATVDFGAKTTYNRDGDVTVTVVGFGDTADEDAALTVVQSGAEGSETDIKDGKLTLKAGKNMAPGKYTIRVTQKDAAGIPAGAQPASATMQVTVVQGIKALAVNSVPEIYVQQNKNGTAKITPVYNSGDVKPKKTEVTYEVGQMVEVEEEEQFQANDFDKKVTVDKKGTVTVKKGYEDGDITGNAFAVKVTANDYEGNTTSAIAQFTIKTAPQKLDKVVLVEKSDETYTEVTPAQTSKNKTAIYTADQLMKDGVSFRVLVPKAEESLGDGEDLDASTLTEDDFVDASLYTLSFNKKEISQVNGKITVKKPVKGVKVTAKTNDGGNQSVNASFEIDYEAVTGPKIQVKTAGSFADFTKGDDGKNTMAVSTETSAILAVKAVDEEGTDLSNKVVDYKISVSKGAAIVSKDPQNLDLQIVMTAKAATLKLTNLNGKKTVAEYTITNANFEKENAPAVSLKKGTKIYAGYRNTESQKIDFTIAKLAQKSNLADISKVRITARDDASKTLLTQIVTDTEMTREASGDVTVSVTAPTKKAAGAFQLTFKGDVKKATLFFEFLNEDGEALTKTTGGVTLNPVKLKKSYKLKDKYNMAAKDTAKVALVHAKAPENVKKEGDAYAVEFTGLLNANIKGTVNEFTSSFALENGILSMKDETKAAVKNNNIGFVTYEVTYLDGTKEDFTTKLTITLKNSVKKLKAGNAKVLNAADMAPVIQVKDDKTVCALAAAGYSKGSDNSAQDADFVIDAEKSDLASGKVVLKWPDEKANSLPAAGTKKKLELTVIPADSLYAAAYEDQQNDAKEEFLTTNGVKLTLQVEIAKTDTDQKKVTIVKKDLNVNFKNVEAAEKKYVKEVSYTVAIPAGIQTVSADRANDKNGKAKTPAWIDFKKAVKENTIEIGIDAEKYAEAVASAGKFTSGTKKGKYKENGTAVKATVIFTYTADGAKADSFTFTITPPILTDAEIAEAAPCVVTVTSATDSVAQGGETTFTAAVTKNDQAVENATVTWKVEGTAEVSSGTAVDSNGKLTVAEAESNETLTVTATYTADDGKTYSGTAAVTVTPKAAD